MVANSVKQAAPVDTSPETRLAAAAGTRSAIAWSSVLFAFLQSVCTFFAALNGVRLVIGVSAFALSAAAGQAMERFHSDWIRVPMILVALTGSLLNLVILFQIRRLRSRPASQWRQQPVSPQKLRSEKMQFILAIATLVLIAIEESIHVYWCHHL